MALTSERLLYIKAHSARAGTDARAYVAPKVVVMGGAEIHNNFMV